MTWSHSCFSHHRTFEGELAHFTPPLEINFKPSFVSSLFLSSSSSSSRRQICKARLHTKVSQTRLLPYAHSNIQLFRLCLNELLPGARTTNVRGKTVPSWGSSNAEAASAEASCQSTGVDKVAVISRPQSWSCRHRVHTSRKYFGHRPWWQSNVISAILKVTRCIIGCQCNVSRSVDVMWSLRRIPVMSRAAVRCRTDCSRRWTPSATPYRRALQ